MKKIESIQSLRGIAAIMIVIIHATALSDYYLKASSPRLTFQLNSGVDIFFVISGIIMSALLFRTKEFNPIDFLTRRIIRVAPLYWICTLVWCFIFFQQAASNPSLLIRSILFIPPLGENDELEPFLAIGWSLTYEIFFYLTLAIFYKGRPINFLFIITLLYISLSLFSRFYVTESALLHILLSPLKLEFLSGLWIGWAFVKKPNVSRTTSFLSFFLGILILFLFPLSSNNISDRYFYWGIPAALITFGFINFKGRQSIFNAWLGDISYSLYLTHVFSIRFFSRLLLIIFPSSAPWHLMLASLFGSILIAGMCFRFIEKPLLEKINRLYKHSTQPDRQHIS